VRCGVLARGEGGAGVLPQKRCDWTGRRQNWLTVAGPMPRAVRLCFRRREVITLFVYRAGTSSDGLCPRYFTAAHSTNRAR
jgi:hypothetical protein